MDDKSDTAQVIARPPLAWALSMVVGFALNGLVPLPFLPRDLPADWLGATMFVLALAVAAWAIVTIVRAGSNVPTNRPTTTIVESGPYRFTRNPIYLGMFLGRFGARDGNSCPSFMLLPGGNRSPPIFRERPRLENGVNPLSTRPDGVVRRADFDELG